MPRATSQSATHLGLLLKSGTLRVTLKMRSKAYDSPIVERVLVYTRGDVIGVDAIEAISLGVRLKRMSCSLSTTHITLLQLNPSASDSNEVVTSASDSNEVVNAISHLAATHYLRKLLQTMDIFAPLDSATIDRLVLSARRMEYGTGEVRRAPALESPPSEISPPPLACT